MGDTVNLASRLESQSSPGRILICPGCRAKLGEDFLYEARGPIEISKTLKAKNLNIEPDMVKMEHPIKEANTATVVPLNLGYGIEAKVEVAVVALQSVKK